MELLLVYFYKQIKDKTVELDYNGISFINLLFLLWAAGELLGFLLGFKLASSWLIRYLIGSSCGAGAGWFVYRKAISLDQRSPDYFDLRQSKPKPYIADKGEAITKQANGSEVLKSRNNPGTESFPAQSGLQPIFNQNEIRQPEKRPELSEDEQQAESSPRHKPEVEVRPEQKPEVKVRPEYKPETDVGFRTPFPQKVQNSVEQTIPKKVQNSVEQTVPTTVTESVTATNRNIFNFPYGELLSINELLISEYGAQTVKDFSISECQWFSAFNAKYEKQEIKAVLMILENALCEELTNGLIWLLFGVLYKDFYHDYDKALQFCLTGAKRCDSYKTALLTEAAELLLCGMKDIGNAFKFFSLAIVAITDASRAWGNPNVDGCIAQERAFHFVRVLLTAFNFKDYRLYLERNIQFTTGMDQALIENVLAICAESPFRTEIEQKISQMFPLIIEKVQALG